MDTRYVFAWISGLLLGVVGGSVGGYIVASNGGMMRGGNHADVATTDHRVESGLSKNEANTSSMTDPFDKSVIPRVPFEEGGDIQEFISWFKCRSYELNRESGGLQIVVGHPLVHEPELSQIRFTCSDRNLSPRQVLDAFSKQTGIRYSIRPCAVLWERTKTQEAEQVAPSNHHQPSSSDDHP